jgi:acyl-CoA synthetase (AMP-forming)/AMP-acid ligase II
MTNVANGLVDAARLHDGRPALRLGDTRVSFAEVDDASARVAVMLRGKGLHPGDRVGLMLPNVPSFPPIYYGVLRAGGVVVPMNPLLKSREVAFYLGDSGARWIFAFAGFADEASKGAAEASAECVVVTPEEFEQTLAAVAPDTQVIEREPEDTAVIFYTSGTTGKPKGAELTHANLSKNAEVSSRLFSLTSDDVIFGGLPMFHSFGQTCALNASVQLGHVSPAAEVRCRLRSGDAAISPACLARRRVAGGADRKDPQTGDRPAARPGWGLTVASGEAADPARHDRFGGNSVIAGTSTAAWCPRRSTYRRAIGPGSVRPDMR